MQKKKLLAIGDSDHDDFTLDFGGFGGPDLLSSGQSKDPRELMKRLSGWWFFATPLKNDGVRQLG